MSRVRDKLLTDEQTTKIMLAFGYGRNVRGFSKEELGRVLQWAENAMFDRSVLDLVFDGQVILDLNENGEVLFKGAPGV